MSGFVDEIYVASEGGTAMTRVSEVDAVAEEGLRGDRYAEGRGYWSGIDECQVTLIEGEAIDAIEAGTDLRIIHGEHRRNIVTRAIRAKDAIEIL